MHLNFPLVKICLTFLQTLAQAKNTRWTGFILA